MSNAVEEYDVLIVGAGPAGVTCANFMGLMGIKTLIVDREKDILDIPRAIAVDEEGSRILQSIGIWEEFSKTLVEIDKVKMVSPFSGDLINLDASQPINGYRRCRTMKQPDLERALHKGMARFPHVTIKRLTEMLSFEDTGSGIYVDLEEKKSGKTRIKCQYLLACDGANSPTRKMLGYELVGSTYERDWVVLDTHNDLTPEDRSQIEFSCDPHRSAVSMPAPNGGRRWEFILQPDEDREEILKEENLQRLLDNWQGKDWGKIQDLQVERKTVYTFSARVSDGFKKGNVLLVGDAAHVTPPFIGQGLMAGLRDTSNLCWKVAMAVKGQIAPSILDSYETERRSNTEGMIKLAVYAGKVIMPKNRFHAFIRDRIFGFINAIPFIRERLWGEKSTVKPLNAFKDGFVMPSKPVKNLEVGAWYPQAAMAKSCGAQTLIDDAIGLNWAVLGIGLDPAEFLSPEMASQWQRWNGKLVRIDQNHSGACSTNTLSLEDLSGVYQGITGKDLCVLIRPDRHIAGLIPARELSASLSRFMNAA